MSARYITGKPINPCCHGVVTALKRLALRMLKEDGLDALRYAQQARREFPGMLVFMGDIQHVWRIEEL